MTGPQDGKNEKRQPRYAAVGLILGTAVGFSVGGAVGAGVGTAIGLLLGAGLDGQREKRATEQAQVQDEQ